MIATRDASAPAVRLAYSSNRQGQHLQFHLVLLSGEMQADAFAGYDEACADVPLREAGRMAHARRKIRGLHAWWTTPTTTDALRQIGEP